MRFSTVRSERWSYETIWRLDMPCATFCSWRVRAKSAWSDESSSGVRFVSGSVSSSAKLPPASATMTPFEGVRFGEILWPSHAFRLVFGRAQGSWRRFLL
jgi:hypothetical protein